MKTAKRLLCVLLALMMAFQLTATVFAEDNDPETPAEVPQLVSLDTSAIDGKMYAYVGEETYFVVYPEPTEAESRFDIRNAEITCSEEGIIDFKTEKEHRFGSVQIVGLKLGKTIVTVKDPESGLTCSVEVTVLPGIIYKLINLHNFLPLVPYLIFMRIVKIVSGLINS